MSSGTCVLRSGWIVCSGTELRRDATLSWPWFRIELTVADEQRDWLCAGSIAHLGSGGVEGGTILSREEETRDRVGDAKGDAPGHQLACRWCG